ncbi:MAG TPA: hypothetical protein VK457_23365 [Chloroflexota bacterium]|nr:hypothetical protein [Chloroflexota bacterium]
MIKAWQIGFRHMVKPSDSVGDAEQLYQYFQPTVFGIMVCRANFEQLYISETTPNDGDGANEMLQIFARVFRAHVQDVSVTRWQAIGGSKGRAWRPRSKANEVNSQWGHVDALFRKSQALDQCTASPLRIRQQDVGSPQALHREMVEPPMKAVTVGT